MVVFCPIEDLNSGLLHFYYPKGWIGRFISWWTDSPYSHVALEIGPGAVLLTPLKGPPIWVPTSLFHGYRPPAKTIPVALKPNWSKEDITGWRFQPFRSLWWSYRRKGNRPNNCITILEKYLAIYPHNAYDPWDVYSQLGYKHA